MNDVEAILDTIIDSGAVPGISKLLIDALYDSPKSVIKLRRLLQSANPEAVGIGVFVASELGGLARPLTRDMLPIFASEDCREIAGALDVVLVNATEGDGDVIAKGLCLVARRNSDVRSIGINFLSSLDVSQIEWAIPHILDARLRSQAVWLVGVVHDGLCKEVSARIDSADSVVRSFGLAAAVHLASIDVSGLKRATLSKDPVIADYAAHRLNQMF